MSISLRFGLTLLVCLSPTLVSGEESHIPKFLSTENMSRIIDIKRKNWYLVGGLLVCGQDGIAKAVTEKGDRAESRAVLDAVGIDGTDDELRLLALWLEGTKSGYVMGVTDAMVNVMQAAGNDARVRACGRFTDSANEYLKALE